MILHSRNQQSMFLPPVAPSMLGLHHPLGPRSPPYPLDIEKGLSNRKLKDPSPNVTVIRSTQIPLVKLIT